MPRREQLAPRLPGGGRRDQHQLLADERGDGAGGVDHDHDRDGGALGGTRPRPRGVRGVLPDRPARRLHGEQRGLRRALRRRDAEPGPDRGRSRLVRVPLDRGHRLCGRRDDVHADEGRRGLDGCRVDGRPAGELLRAHQRGHRAGRDDEHGDDPRPRARPGDREEPLGHLHAGTAGELHPDREQRRNGADDRHGHRGRTLAPLSCSRADALAPAASYPALTLSVDVSLTAPASLTNTATVSTPGDPNPANDTATDVTTIAQLPDLAITKSHAGTFTQGQPGTYTVTVSNVGPGPTTGTVTVTDTLPAGLTATGFSGTGWTCTLAPLSCSRADALAPAAS
ncbi:MAG: DUF11 domain-containing protein, partial [Acidobacteria bacterium]